MDGQETLTAARRRTVGVDGRCGLGPAAAEGLGLLKVARIPDHQTEIALKGATEIGFPDIGPVLRHLCQKVAALRHLDFMGGERKHDPAAGAKSQQVR